MKKLFFIAITIAFASCKTIKVSEKSAFQESKYKLEASSSYIKLSNKSENEKNTAIQALNKVIETQDTLIFNINEVELLRNFINHDNIKMEYFVFKPKNIQKIGVYFLGNTTNILNVTDYLIELSAQTNAKIYVLHYRGYGKSEGTPSFKSQFDDNNYFFKTLLASNQQIDFVLGYSLGSVFATYAAIDNNIHNIFLLSPFSETKDYFTHFKNQSMKGGKSLLKPFVKITADDYLLNISNINKLKSFKGKLVIFHGKSDNILPYTMGKKIYNSYISNTKKLYTIEGGNHSAAFQQDQWEQLINEINTL
ncbi:alpha/beta hydrolase [Flavobacterium branchiophilum NBRC 15030 = ATCC 35035]|uniref:AB hydrolase-1 domain-containing protein n=2 Tax=Flavobacterium branchiophilum TaxID=55197 RepID=A0A543G6H8_9FLAO|nr:alpha/beta fold hydrolase [Flavobacterium branchiophilum]TQM41693.1 hypothetical protein BC670_2687 [Flavobacterium branchiophilum]GEM56310.1 alpha/beta hydrolase [Flavobacterium branchiophilum NBRC 15030 = ATCC 35035]